MTSRQAAVIASRVLCVWFIYEAVVEAVYLPSFIIIALEQSARLHSAVNAFGRGYPSNWDFLLNPLGGLFHLILNIALAVFFYRGGPGLIRFLTGDEVDSDSVAVGPTV
jgi:hypothetical protein